MPGPVENDQTLPFQPAIFGFNDPAAGTQIFSDLMVPYGVGVWGMSSQGGAGVRGDDSSAGYTSETQADPNVYPIVGPPADRPAGVYGTSSANYGIYGSSSSGTGVYGQSQELDGVGGVSASPQHAGVSAVNNAAATGTTPSAFGLWASSNNTGVYAQGTPAGYFAGDVQVTGDVILINPGSGDIAEDFDAVGVQASLEPGTVLVIDADGKLSVSDAPYDTRVAGVISGAGGLKPAVVFQRFPSANTRVPVALLGKVFCKVDAAGGRISAGDLLTTSPVPGHAMKVVDRSRALGAIIGKALANFDGRTGMIPIMVSLR
jgi:hypothetical protein